MLQGSLDAHAKPPTNIHEIYKKYRKLVPAAARSQHQYDGSVLVESVPAKVILQKCHDRHRLVQQLSGVQGFPDICAKFLADSATRNSPVKDASSFGATETLVYEVPHLPGLYVYPSLFSPEVQMTLLNTQLHRDLANPDHLTNVHMHYHIPYHSLRSSQDGGTGDSTDGSRSFFAASPSSSSQVFLPKDPAVHKPLTTAQFLRKKLRWMTLGGQYDWTNKVYPAGAPPAFPSDVRALIEGAFPMRAEAAIVNVYSPGHTLSLHRDVSEECDAPLVSVSLGCEALFVVGLEGVPASDKSVAEMEDSADESKARLVVLRLRSGDAVLMSGESRYAWHGVPKVLEGTCPAWMQDWPAAAGQNDGEGDDGVDRYEHWRGWMSGKRININVRQMFA